MPDSNPAPLPQNNLVDKKGGNKYSNCFVQKEWEEKILMFWITDRERTDSNHLVDRKRIRRKILIIWLTEKE